MGDARIGSRLGRDVTRRLDRLVGGAHRRQVVVTFAAVLALNSADGAAVGADATQLEAGLGINRSGVGLLLSAGGFIGIVATLPAGVLVDRICRVRLLSYAVAAWGLTTLLSGLAPNFQLLLGIRALYGVLTAVGGPATASLIGDYFPSADRGRIYGYVLTGELIGAGFGFVVAGQFANLSWRAPFLALSVPTALVWWLLRHLDEPERSGGENEPVPVGHAIRYVLSVRTNVVLIIASALGYFFFSGLRGFAVQFAKHQYGVSQTLATMLTLVLGAGALAGVLTGGRLADRLLQRGRKSARVEVSGVAVLAAAVLFVPSLITTHIGVALPLLTLATLFLGMSNPPLDAARLDIIVPSLWGRAEAIRSVLRNSADSSAPVLFGVLSDGVFAGSAALEYTFLTALLLLFVATIILLVFARRTYPHDAHAAAQRMKHVSA